MKKLIMLGLGMGLFVNVFATETITFFEEQLGDYGLKFKGTAEGYLKSQNDYETALDNPSINVFAREGASERDEQIDRYELTLSLFSGIPGQTTFFNYLSVEIDPNNPDDDPEKLQLEHAFVMWRPEIGDVRPFGLTIGQYTVKQTINAAYSNKFSGDFEDDFVAYSGTGVREKPMLALDMHFSEDTAIGYSFVKGSSDLLESAVRYDDDYTYINVLWAESKIGNMGINTAYQNARGARGNYTVDLSAGGTESVDSDYDYETNVFNIQMTYLAEISQENSLKPFIAYQILQGEEAPSFEVLGVDWENESPEVKDQKVEIQTVGLIYSTKIKEKKVRFSGEYSNIESEDYNGLSGVSDGILDYGVEDYGIIDLTTGVTYDAADGKFLGITGDSSAISSLSGADGMFHFEAAVDMNESLTLTFFINGVISTDVNTDATQDDIDAIESVLTNDMGYTDTTAAAIAAAGGITGVSTVADLAEYLANALADKYDSMTKWTDTTSVGISVKYSF